MKFLKNLSQNYEMAYQRLWDGLVSLMGLQSKCQQGCRHLILLGLKFSCESPSVGVSKKTLSCLPCGGSSLMTWQLLRASDPRQMSQIYNIPMT